jgi:hypothetical protein
VAVMIWPSVPSLYGSGGFEGDAVDMHLKEAGLSDVLGAFSQIAGLEIEWEPCVDTMHVTLRLDAVPWDRALYDILGSRGLEAELVDGVLTIVCPSRDEIDLPSELEASEFSANTDHIASLHVSFGKTRILSSAGMCGVQPIHEVSLLGLQDSAIPQALARPLLARVAGKGVVKIEICGTAASLEQAGDFQREIHGSKAFFGPTFREVRHEDGGGIDFVMTTFFYVDGGGPGAARPIDP